MANYFRALGLAALPPVIWYPPAARRYRNRRRHHPTLGCALGCGCGLGLGDTAQVSSVASYATAGAKLGSIVPGVGNVVGAIIGAIAGALIGKKKPVRATPEQVAQCKQLLNEYESAVAKFPGQMLGGALDEASLRNLWICYQTVHAGGDPRFFDGNWQIVRDMAIEAVKKTFDTPAGTEVLLTSAGRRDRKGKPYKLFEVRWINTDAVSLQTVTAKFFEFLMAGCYCCNKRDWCDGRYNQPLYRNMARDLIHWAALTYLPQVQVPAEPTAPMPQPAAPQPAIAPAERALPSPAPATSAIVPVPASSLPPGVAPPAVLAPPLPANAGAADVHAAIARIAEQVMQTQQAQQLSQQQTAAAATAAAQQYLNSQGVRVAPAAVAKTAQETVKQSGSSVPLWLGAGALLVSLLR